MNVPQDKTRGDRKVAVSTLPVGSCILNGEGNLCLIIRPTEKDQEDGKVRLCNLAHGGHYAVLGSCLQEPVFAQVTWSYK